VAIRNAALVKVWAAQNTYISACSRATRPVLRATRPVVRATRQAATYTYAQSTRVPQLARSTTSAIKRRVRERRAEGSLLKGKIIAAKPKKVSIDAVLKELREAAAEALAFGGWDSVIDKDGVKVWKRYYGSDVYGAEMPAVKSHAVVTATPEQIADLIFDSDRCKEYNKYSEARTDALVKDKDTKIVWNRTKPPSPAKSHDFATLMHRHTSKDGTIVVRGCAAAAAALQLLRLLLTHSLSSPLSGAHEVDRAPGRPQERQLRAQRDHPRGERP